MPPSKSPPHHQTVDPRAVAIAFHELHQAQFGGGFAETVQGDQIGGTLNDAAEPDSPSLAVVVLEIQCLVKQLKATNPAVTEAEQTAFVTAAISPSLRRRAVDALQSGDKVMLGTLLNHPGVKGAIAIIESWQRTK